MPHFQPTAEDMPAIRLANLRGTPCFIWGTVERAEERYAVATFVDGGEAREETHLIFHEKTQSLVEDEELLLLLQPGVTELFFSFGITPHFDVVMLDGSTVEAQFIDMFPVGNNVYYIMITEEEVNKPDDAGMVMVCELVDGDLHEIEDERSDELLEIFRAQKASETEGAGEA